MNKIHYEKPTSELLVVQIEGNFCGTTFSSKGTELMTVDSEEDF